VPALIPGPAGVRIQSGGPNYRFLDPEANGVGTFLWKAYTRE